MRHIPLNKIEDLLHELCLGFGSTGPEIIDADNILVLCDYLERHGCGYDPWQRAVNTMDEEGFKTPDDMLQCLKYYFRVSPEPCEGFEYVRWRLGHKPAKTLGRLVLEAVFLKPIKKKLEPITNHLKIPEERKGFYSKEWYENTIRKFEEEVKKV